MFRFNQTIRSWSKAALVIALAIPAISWNDSLIHSNGLLAELYQTDTIPAGSLDDHIRKLEQARETLDGKLAEKDWARMEKDIEKQIQQALTALQDNKKLLQSDLKNMDIEMQKVQQAMQEVKKEIEKSQAQIQNDLRVKMPDLKKELEKAKISMAEASKELESYREMINDMESKGLISDKNNYRIEYRNETLFINGKEQPKETADRYRKYFRKKNLVISNEQNRFDVENDE